MQLSPFSNAILSEIIIRKDSYVFAYVTSTYNESGAL